MKHDLSTITMSPLGTTLNKMGWDGMKFKQDVTTLTHEFIRDIKWDMGQDGTTNLTSLLPTNIGSTPCTCQESQGVPLVRINNNFN